MIKGYLAVAGLFRVAYEDYKMPVKTVRYKISDACSQFKQGVKRSFELMGQYPLQ